MADSLDTLMVAASFDNPRRYLFGEGYGDQPFEVWVSEQHDDTMTITRHPVETGAAITDHAFPMMPQLTVKLGASAAFLSGAAGSGLDSAYAGLTQAYQTLLTMQQSATLLEVQTGKRLYRNMLIRSLRVETAPATEFVLSITLQLQGVLFVSTSQTVMPPTASQASPQATAAVTDTGSKAAQPYSGAVPA